MRKHKVTNFLNLKLLQTLRCLNANLKRIYLQLHILNVKLQACDIDIVLGHRSAVGGNTDSILLLLLFIIIRQLLKSRNLTYSHSGYCSVNTDPEKYFFLGSVTYLFF